MKILKYDIIRYERTDVMNYKINMKCELKNVSETLKDKQEELKKYYLELNTMYLKQKEKSGLLLRRHKYWKYIIIQFRYTILCCFKY